MSGVTNKLDQQGRLPPVKLEVFPLDQSKQPFTIDHFNSYSFSSNILVPVDTFSFSFRPPPASNNKPGSTYDKIVQEGDTVQLTCDGEAISTGYVDTVDVAVDADAGVIMSVNGRDLMGYLEDNDAVNFDSTVIYMPDPGGVRLSTALQSLMKDTRIRGYEFVNASDFTNLFMTIPGESKLAALQRFLEMPNYLAWMSPIGKIRIGSPSFGGSSVGNVGIRALDKKRTGNVLSMNVRRASGQIPNAVLPVWTGNEKVQAFAAAGVKINQAVTPNRLYKAGHKIMRCIVTSAPNATAVQDLSSTKLLSEAGGNQYLLTLAARELARENINELIVSSSMIGHLNDNGDPFAVDQLYDVTFDAAGLDETMYLYGLEYVLSEDAGQQTHLQFCKVNTIVAGGPAAGGA